MCSQTHFPALGKSGSSKPQFFKVGWSVFPYTGVLSE